MAVFGIQLAFSMITASIISKLGSKVSLAKWVLCHTGLIRYLHPTDDELRALAGVPKDVTSKGKGSKGKHNPDLKNPHSFHVPKNLDITLESVKVTEIEVKNLKFYEEFHWVVDYTLYATLVYTMTEIYYAIFNVESEMNLSVFWCLLALVLSFKVQISLMAIYFRGDEVMGERALCLVMGFVYLLIAMIVLVISEDILEVGIDPAYKSFYDNASSFLENRGLPSSGPASKLIIKFTIAVCCGFVGALFTFPGIRMSKMFNESLKYCESRPMLRLAVNLTYVSPFLLAILWIKPIARTPLTQSPWSKGSQPLMSEANFESLRLLLVLGMVLLRILLMSSFLQTFLNTAQDSLTSIKNEAGRILNIELQKKVARVYYFLCIAALQYITPCLICLHLCFMYKTLGGGRWIGSFANEHQPDGNPTSEETSSGPQTILPESDAFQPAKDHFTLALASLKQVFNSTVFNGIFGFSTWWCIFCMFASSAVGSFYISYTNPS